MIEIFPPFYGSVDNYVQYENDRVQQINNTYINYLWDYWQFAYFLGGKMNDLVVFLLIIIGLKFHIISNSFYILINFFFADAF